MTAEQFETLRDWISLRARILQQMNAHPYDAPRISALVRELQECDDEACVILVDAEEL